MVRSSPATPDKPTADKPAADKPDRRVAKCEQIIAVASRLFADLGYADCDMERVAAKLKIAKGTLYLYFANKEALFFACVDHGMQAMQAAVQAASDGETEPFRRISAAIRAYLEFFEAHPEQVELIIQERAGFKNRKRPTYFNYRDSSRARWREVYARLQKEGRIRADIPVDRLLESVGNLVYGTMFTNHFVGRSTPLDDQHRALMELIFRGLWTDGEREAAKPPRATRRRS